MEDNNEAPPDQNPHPHYNQGDGNMYGYNDQNPQEKKKDRPVVITVFCVIGFIGAGVVFPLMMTDIYDRVIDQIGEWYTPFLLFSAAMGLASFIGMWKMKKWGVYLYTAMTALSQVVMFAMDQWTPLGIIMPAIVIAVGFNHINKME